MADGFIDGGANIGTYSLLASGIVGPGGLIVAFEPVPKLARRFRENIALNGIDWVELHEAALADRSGLVSFVSDRDVSNRIVPEGSGERNKIHVPSTSLDECLPPDARFAMAKFDLEGAEVAALRPDRLRYEFSLRLYTARELTLMARDAGLDVTETYGSFDRKPIGFDAPRLILVARKP